MLKKLFSREWLLTTILVLIGSAVCVRLGIWQLDRLEQRRAFNSHIETMWASEPLLLPDDLANDLLEMEYRSICVLGELDFGNQVILRNQYWQDQFGYHLLTPMIMDNGMAVIIDRGWIPAEGNDDPSGWVKYDEPADLICGIVRQGTEKPDVGGRPDPTLAPGEEGLSAWNNVNLVRLSEQTPYPLVNIYVQVDPGNEDLTPPIPFQPDIEITEGPHLGYAGQWFTFAALLFFGYPFYVKRREGADE